MDNGDKGLNKVLSVAYKYAMFITFTIPTKELIDPDSESHDPKPKTEVKTPTKEVQKMKKTYENSIERMKETMKSSFIVLGKEKVTLGNFKVSLRNSKSISIVDEDKLPESVFVMKKEVSKSWLNQIRSSYGNKI